MRNTNDITLNTFIYIYPYFITIDWKLLKKKTNAFLYYF